MKVDTPSPLKGDPKLPLPKNEPVFDSIDCMIFLESSDLPKDIYSPGPSACIWQIRTLDGIILDSPDPKQSRGDNSDEKRGLAAALIGALEKLAPDSRAVVCSPGTYIKDGIAFAEKWRANGWRNSHNEPVANSDIWERYLELVNEHNLDVIALSWSENSCTKLRKKLKEAARKACRDRA